jgi:hypothetical protein
MADNSGERKMTNEEKIDLNKKIDLGTREKVVINVYSILLCRKQCWRQATHAGPKGP